MFSSSLVAIVNKAVTEIAVVNFALRNPPKLQVVSIVGIVG